MFLGSAPDSWGVWFASDPQQPPWERFLDELVAAGYEWFELGPYGYLPTDPHQLQDEVGRRGLKVSGGAVFGALHDDSSWESDVADARRVCSLVNALGAHHLIYLPQMYRDLEGNFLRSAQLDDDEWRRLVRRMSEMGRIVSGDYGVDLVFHPHADSHVATQPEVERFLTETDPEVVKLCLDTGHIAYCRGDNLALIKEFPERIGYVHLKQVAPDILEQVESEDLCFAEAVRRGAMCEPPGGIPDMGPLIDALRTLDSELFAIVEQDLYPCDPEVPLPIATRTRTYLNGCGLGTGTGR
jgi:inosose dehydratase